MYMYKCIFIYYFIYYLLFIIFFIYYLLFIKVCKQLKFVLSKMRLKSIFSFLNILILEFIYPTNILLLIKNLFHRKF